MQTNHLELIWDAVVGAEFRLERVRFRRPDTAAGAPAKR